MVSVLQMRCPLTSSDDPAPGCASQPLPSHFITRICACVSFVAMSFPWRQLLPDSATARPAFADNSVKYEATLRFINGNVRTMLDAIKGQ